MAQPEEIREIRQRLEGHVGPMLSAYLSVNARFGENQGQAYKVRLKDALEELEVPDIARKRVLGSVEDQVHPRARTVVFFADEGGLFERLNLQVDAPEAFRYGEPYLAPLVMALEEHEPYGVALFDAERFRFFVSAPMDDPGGGSEGGTSGFFKEIDLDPSEPYPRGGGSTDMDAVGRVQEENVHRFFKDMGERTRALAFSNGVRHLILAGPKERTSEFRETLPQEVRERVVAEDNVPSEAPEKEIFDRLEEVYEKAEQEREAGLVEGVRESGVRGVKDTIEALQEGRVYHLLALYELEGEIRWCDHDELAITDVTSEECPFCGRQTRMRALSDVILDLAAARSARVQLVRARDEVVGGPNEDAEQRGQRDEPADVLRDEFEGLAGLIRY
jgi:hypothetical protein